MTATQLDMLARASDPQSSHEAAAMPRYTLRDAVLDIVVSLGWGCRGTVTAAIRRQEQFRDVEGGSVSRRLKELADRGLLERTDRRVDGGRGAPNYIYVPTAEGRQEAHS